MDSPRSLMWAALLMTFPCAALLLGLLLPQTSTAMVTAALGLLTVINFFTIAETLCAMRARRSPPPDVTSSGDVETPIAATAVILAYLPNEQHIIAATVRYFLCELRGRCPLQVIVSYNSPKSLPVEAELQKIADAEPRLTLLKVSNSRSKAANFNAAIDRVDTPIVGFFDADSHPCPECFDKAATWLRLGYDLVQGSNNVRRSHGTKINFLVFLEYLLKYGVAYAGRYRGYGVTYFTGTNGYWRTKTARELRARDIAQVEDIDMSVRGLLAGKRVAYDPAITATEDPPPHLHAWWTQRVRWAQGWAQLLKWHQIAIVQSERLDFTTKCVWTFFLSARRLLVPGLYLILL